MNRFYRRSLRKSHKSPPRIFSVPFAVKLHKKPRRKFYAARAIILPVGIALEKTFVYNRIELKSDFMPIFIKSVIKMW